MQNSYNFEGVRTSPPGSTDGCYLPKSTCDNDGSVDCDINIFISMYGTDVDGKYLQSANARQSTFMVRTDEERSDSKHNIPHTHTLPKLASLIANRRLTITQRRTGCLAGNEGGERGRGTGGEKRTHCFSKPKPKPKPHT